MYFCESVIQRSFESKNPGFHPSRLKTGAFLGSIATAGALGRGLGEPSLDEPARKPDAPLKYAGART